ncbi:unnamed protein product [Spirodela intermedia]|uniref:Uncharacterized protein n=1 Tax=Spirodela intermedia TaxID=51605 RepID=A0A7I8K4L3_SPIIN|nr:unnamed protein product [Spirodela intermedia]
MYHNVRTLIFLFCEFLKYYILII